MDTTRTIGNRIRARRSELHMTQEELAVRAGLSRRTLIAVEAGKTDITLTRLLSVLSVLGLEIGLTEAARTKRRPRESELLEIFGEDE